MLGPVAALISGITAALTALIGSLGFAAAAIGGVALGLVGPLAGGIGVAILALKNLDDETGRAVRSLRVQFSDLGKSAGEAIGPGLREAVETLSPSIAKLEPIIDGIAEALGRVAVGWAEITEGQPFRSFLRVMERELPGAVEKLGIAIGNFGEGMLGVFRGVIPITNRFLDWLVKITAEFDEWANSAAGRREIREFFRDAADSAKAVGDFLGAATDALGELLSMGRGSGDSLFTSMADSFRDLTRYLQQNPDAVASWFGNGEQVARDIGNALIDIGEAIDDLDNPETRELLHDLFVLLEGIVKLIGDLGTIWSKVTDSVTDQLSILTTGFDNLMFGIDSVIWAAKATGDAIVDALTAPKDAIDDLIDEIVGIDWSRVWSGLQAATERFVGRLPGFFAGMAGKIANAMGDLNWGRVITNPASRVVGWFSGLARRITNAVGDVDWSRIIPNPIQKVLGWFSGLGNRIVQEIGSVSWTSIINNPIDNILGWFQGLGARITQAIGSVTIRINVPDPTPGFDIPGVPWAASGRLVDRPTILGVGEAGREAIVPLDRPLHLVDPAVRDLAAYAQGRGQTEVVDRTYVAPGAIQINEVSDGATTAMMTLNELVARTG